MVSPDNAKVSSKKQMPSNPDAPNIPNFLGIVHDPATDPCK
jgi:hypothetical protein